MRPNRSLTLIAGAAILSLTLTACAESERGEEGGEGKSGGTLTFGAAGAPNTFDPFLASDGETFRVTRQMYEGLLEIEPGSSEVGPGLATEWDKSEDGKTWTFKLREGVKFHDGTDFNADAVCKNVERWETLEQPGASTYWDENFAGIAGEDGKSEGKLLESCEAKGENEVVLKITRTTSKFPVILSHSPFAMQSPTAMDKYKANDVKPQGDGYTYPDYAWEHPTGTGPFKFESYDQANGTITIVRNEDYWNSDAKAKLDKLVFKILPDESTRRQELQAGSIQGYDLPNPVDWEQLKSDGNQVHIRDPFNIFYVGFSPKANPALKDLKVRQALLYGLNREQIVKQQLPEGANVATQFLPDTVEGFNDEVQEVPYDPEKAKELLKEAGQENLEIELWYPAEVTRPYMPNPKALFDAMKSDWDKLGITVKPVTKPWNGGYLDSVDKGNADAFFLGWTGDWNAADNFIGTFFGSTTNRFQTGEYEWGDQLAKDLDAADSEVDEGKREDMFKDLNKKLVEEYLPALPISSSPPAIVVGPNVKGLEPSPLTSEDFSTVSLDD